MNYSISAIILVCQRINMLRSMQAQGTWLQVKSLPNLTAPIPKNLSVISVESGDRNKPAQSLWVLIWTSCRSQRKAASYQLWDGSDWRHNCECGWISRLRAWNPQWDGWRDEGGRKDCKWGVGVLRAPSWKVRDLGWGPADICRQTDTNKHKCVHRGIHMYIYSRNNEDGSTQKCRRVHKEKKRLAACVNNLRINHSMSGANQLWLSHRFMPFPSLQMQSPPAICISNKAAIHIHWLMISECY